MFPKLAGGVAIFAHEAWKRYTSFVGPIAAVGYWIGWSVVLAISGLIVGQLLQNQFYTGSEAAGSSWTHHQSLILGVNFDLNFPICVGIFLIACIWVANVFGVRPAVWVGYVTGALLLIPLAVLIFVPYITGDWSSSNLHNHIHPLTSVTGNRGIRLVIVWLYIMCWSSYGFECCATFAPEYKDPARDTAKALRAAAVFSIFVYGLLPLGAVGTFGDQNITVNNALFFYGDVFKELVGSTAADILVVMLCAGIVLSMNTATMDGSRALYGISQDGMTFRWLGKLNKRNVPGNAMTLDAVLNVILLVCAIGAVGGGYLKVLAVSNFGYVLAHVFAISGFLLLRKDRPGWPRPIRVGPAWTGVAWFCLIYDIVLLVVGSISFKLTGYGSSWSILAWSLVDPGRRARRVHLARGRRGQEAPSVEAAGTHDARGGGCPARGRPPDDHHVAVCRSARLAQRGGRRNGVRVAMSCGAAGGSWSRRQIAVASALLAAPGEPLRAGRIACRARISADTVGLASAAAASAQRERAADPDARDALRGRDAERLSGAGTKHLRRRIAARKRDARPAVAEPRERDRSS